MKQKKPGSGPLAIEKRDRKQPPRRENLTGYDAYAYADDDDFYGDEDQQCLMALINNYREPEQPFDDDDANVNEHQPTPANPAWRSEDDELPF